MDKQSSRNKLSKSLFLSRQDVPDEKSIRVKYLKLVPVITERGRGIWAASESQALGRGGISAVSRATGINRNTIAKGLRELESPETLAADRIR